MCGQCDAMARADDERAQLESDWIILEQARQWLKVKGVHRGADALIETLVDVLERRLPITP